MQLYGEVHLGRTETSCPQPAQIWGVYECATWEMDPLAPAKTLNHSAGAGIFTTTA